MLGSLSHTSLSHDVDDGDGDDDILENVWSTKIGGGKCNTV